MAAVGFPEDTSSFVDIEIINAYATVENGFRATRGAGMYGPTERLLDRLANEIRHGCYELLSLNISGMIQGKATCVAVIATTLTRDELRYRGFTYHGAAPREEGEVIEAPIVDIPEDRDDFIRMDFMNFHRESTFSLMRGGMNGPVERAFLRIHDHVKNGCYRLETLSISRHWCTVGFDTALSQEELRERGFEFHGSQARPGETTNGAWAQPLCLQNYNYEDEE